MQVSPVQCYPLRPGTGRLDPRLPPVRQADITWAFDPGFDTEGTANSIIGPVGTSTGGTFNSGPPPYYGFDATGDFVSFGDALDTTWTGATGWSVLLAFYLTAADIAAASRSIFGKNAGAPNAQFHITCELGKPKLSVYLGGTAANRMEKTAQVALAVGWHRILVTYDPTQTFGPARLGMFIDDAVAATTNATVGSDGVIANTAALLRIGMAETGANESCSRLGYTVAWNGVLTSDEIVAASTWFADLGWQ